MISWLVAFRQVFRPTHAASTLALLAFLAGVVHAGQGRTDFELEDHKDVCSHILRHAGSVNFLSDHLMRYGVFDANNDGRFEIVEQGATGTRGGDLPRLRSLDGSVVPHLYATAADFEPIRWHLGAAWLHYKGRVYYLAFEEEAARFLRAALYLTPDNTMHTICRFDHEVTERMSVRSGKTEDMEFCRRFPERGRSLKVEFEDPSQITVDQLNRSSPGSRHFPRKQASFDFDNDGSKEKILLIGVYSSAGRGCDLTYYDLLDQTGTKVLEGPKRDLLLAIQGVDVDDAYPHKRCGTLSQWVKHEGEIYFETGYAGASPRRAGDLFHRLRAIRSSQVEQICESSFTIRPVLEKSAD